MKRRYGYAIAAVLGIGLFGLSCSKRGSDDEERLKKRIDVPSVHLYASAKKVIASSARDPQLKAAVDRMFAIVTKSDPTRMEAAISQIGLADLVLLGKAVWNLNKEGQEIVRGNKDEGEPLIRSLLKSLQVPGKITDLFNSNTDHAVLFLVEGTLKFHEKSPIPIPPEIALYEGWRTAPEGVTIPAVDSFVWSLRSYYYGTNDFCDLAERDAGRSKESLQKNEKIFQAIELLTEGAVRPDEKDAKVIASTLKMLGDSGPMLCYFGRGDDERARPWLKATIEDIEASGLPVEEEVRALKIVYECGGNDSDIAEGEAELAKLPAPKNEYEKTDREVLKAYCEASKENKIGLLKKISLSAKLIKIAAQTAERSKAVQGLGDSRIYRSVAGITALCEKASSSTSQVSGALDKVKGIFDKKE